MSEWLWSRVDHWGLARFVTPEAKFWLPLSISRYDVRGSQNERLLVIKAIYEELVKKGISYAFEEYHPSNVEQVIRTPSDILDSPREGTCLDLAVLFSGLCLGYDLLPMIIVLEGHALAAVSLNYGRTEWDVYADERTLLRRGPLTDLDLVKLRELVENSSYLAIECTGFAHSEGLGRIQKPRFPESIQRKKGVLSFKRAVEAGKEQLYLPTRRLLFALDIAAAHYEWKIKPYSIGDLPPLDEEAARAQYLEKTLENIYKEPSAVTLSMNLDVHERSSLQTAFQPLKLRRDPLLAEHLVQEERRALQDESEYDGGNAYHSPSVLDSKQPSDLPSRASPDEFAKDGDDALNRSPQKQMIVLGGPGTGKTTLLRHLVSERAKRAMKDPHAPVPLFIRLSRLALSGKTLKEDIVSTVQDMIVDERYASVLWWAVERGQAFICLDGLDEVIDQREDMLRKISNLISSHAGNIWVVSSRFTHLNKRELLDLEKFTMWELLLLDDTLRLELARRLQPKLQQLRTTSNMTSTFDPSEFIRALEKYNKVVTWGRTPLFFSLAAVVFARTGMLPSTNAELYEQVTEGILETREPEEFERKSLHRVLAALALELCLQRKGRVFTSNDLLDILPGIRKEQGENWDTNRMARRITNSGVLQIVAQSTYGFIHQTFQEYLAAKCVISLPRARAEEIIDLLINYIGDTICRQVLVDIVHLVDQQGDILEDSLYRKLITRLGSTKVEMQKAHREDRLDSPSTISWGITYLLQDLVDYWYLRLYSTLENGTADRLEDGEIASTIGSVIETYPRSDAVPALITSMYKYEKKARFIGALGKIGTEQAKSALFTFTKERMENPSDPLVFRYLVPALKEAHVEQAIPLLQAIREGESFEKGVKREARRALWSLGQEQALEEGLYDLEEILAALSPEDEKGRPSDWRRVEAMATWLHHPGYQSSLVQTHLTEILIALEKALHHQHDGARKPVVRALEELGNFQTFHYLTQRLVRHEEPSSDVTQEMLHALIRLGERNQINLEVQELVTIFSKIQRAYPMLADEVSRTRLTLQRHLEREKHDREEN